MGLGKTLQSISLLAYLLQYRNNHGPHMVVVPKATLGNWCKEFKKWCPKLKIFKYYALKDDRDAVGKEFQETEWDVAITTYEQAMKGKYLFKKYEWEYVIVDEAHKLKNDQAIISQCLRSFNSKHRLMLTGTPLQNNLKELWALLNFLVPELFEDAADFSQWFSSSEGEDVQEIIKKLHRILRPFIMRRLKSDVEHSLKPKIETTLYVGQTKMQREWYKQLLLKDQVALQTKTGSRKQLLNILMQLRKVCNHPYIFQGAEPGPPFVEGEHLVQNCGKMILLDKLLNRLKQNGNRVLIFSQMVKMLDILEDYCLFRKYEYCRIDGGSTNEEREQAMEVYNAPNSSKFVFLLSTRAGGLGINLQTADTVILYDSDWNPQADLQAQDRAHRIGQKKQVHVYRLVTQGTIEEKVVERALKKLYLDALVIQQGTAFHRKQTLLESEDMMSMIRHGAEEVFLSTESTVTDEDIDAILEQGRQRTEERDQSLKKDVQSVFSKLSLDGNYESANCYLFEGEDWRDKKNNMEFDFIQLPKRERPALYNNLPPAPKREPKPKKARVFKPTICHDYQFYKNPERLNALEEKEFNLSTPPEKPENDAESDEEKVTSVVKELVPEEKLELIKLRSSGFSDWSKRDFQHFVKGCEKYGRKDIDSIATMVSGKTVAEVKAYSKVFWKRFQEVKGHERFIAAIEKGEQKIVRSLEIHDVLKKKMSKYDGLDPMEHLKIEYPKENTPYSKLEDRFLFCKMAEFGYGNWEELRMAVRKSWMFRFDWFLKSRTAGEIGRRCETLLRYVENENAKPKSSTRASKGASTKTAANVKTAKGSKAVPKKTRTKKTATAATTATTAATGSRKRTKAATAKENEAEPKPKKQKVT
eukprot:TRINITY_DN6803_c0_g1_i1.p1 TRINITY_DN6803_c0_g1~~TRINITY_DN6803_c0_g1_i1.p1  ORF type:complete len:945 (-),score=284.58 TRINITY_DN6803_c0_g1_i1:22-2631(-)